MDLNKNYYQILGVNKQSTIDEIKKTYRNLAKQLHPDKNNGDKTKEDKFKQVSEAYSVLGDETSKKQYDTQSPHGNSYNPNPFAHVGGIDDIFQTFFGGSPFTQANNPFGSFFGARNEYKEFHENLDITVNLIVTLNDVYKGNPIKVSYKRFVHCDTCKGTGFDPKSESYKCEVCDGRGIDNYGRKCNYCQGMGKVYSLPCGDCNDGQKVVLKDAEFNITNVENIRASEDKYLRGFGHQSKYFREKTGDLKLKVIYQEITNHKIIDNKLYYYLDLHYEDAINGVKYEYKTLDDNKLNVSIPEKTKDGDIIRLKGKGLLLNHKGDRDDLFFKINIIIDYDRIQKK